MSDLAEYIAAALIHTAQKYDGGITMPLDDLLPVIASEWSIEVTDETVRGAIRILNRCDISYVESDEFAGTFVVINASRYKNFLDRVARDRAEYDEVVKAAPDAHVGVNRAEAIDLPYLNSYNTFKTIRKYSAFGEEWIIKAMKNIADRKLELNVAVPASDRVVRLDDNDPALVEIRSAAAELKRRIRTGNELGELNVDQAIAAAGEVSQLEDAFSAETVRPQEVVARSRRTLNWIASKAAGSFVGEAAASLLKIILLYFGIRL
jgi:hypothetical protein